MIYIIIERKTYRTKLKSHHKESMKKCIYIEAKQKKKHSSNSGIVSSISKQTNKEPIKQKKIFMHRPSQMQ